MKRLFTTFIALLIVFGASAQCNPTFTTAISSSNYMEVTLTNTTTWNLVPGSTPLISVFWGDGSGFDPMDYHTNSTLVHQYAATGTYSIDIQVVYYDSLNANALVCMDSVIQIVNIVTPCASSITTVDNGGGDFTFTANNIGGGTNITYTWDFGDGNTGTGSPVNHIYATPGSYNVILEAANTTGCVDSSTDSVTVISPCASTLSYINNGGGSYSFTANNIGGGANVTHTWVYGDGTTGTGTSVNHTYNASGTYNVILITSASGGCVDSSFVTILYFSGSLNCVALTANYTLTGFGFSRTFNNTSNAAFAPGVVIVSQARWDFGDGSPIVSNNNNPTHVYTAAGTYTVTMINDWVDSANNTIYCTDTVAHQYTITPPPNEISGNILWDSTLTNAATLFKVWLIDYDTVANTLTAVDSSLINGFGGYVFPNKPAGTYLVKAAVVNGSMGANTLMPTYHYSSVYWNTAAMINHTTGYDINKNIYMITGIPGSGPGFIGGNISQGANKGTNGGVSNLLVILRDANEQPIRFTYTDHNGDYSFGSVPAGTYTVYPEDMGYYTTPSSSLILASGQYYVDHVDFKHTPTHILPITTGVADIQEPVLFSVYPNPTQGIVSVKWDATHSGKAFVQVLDIIGRTVLTAETTMKDQSDFNLSSLQAGVYFLKVTTDNSQHTKRIILQK